MFNLYKTPIYKIKLHVYTREGYTTLSQFVDTKFHYKSHYNITVVLFRLNYTSRKALDVLLNPPKNSIERDHCSLTNVKQTYRVLKKKEASKRWYEFKNWIEITLEKKKKKKKNIESRIIKHRSGSVYFYKRNDTLKQKIKKKMAFRGRRLKIAANYILSWNESLRIDS